MIDRKMLPPIAAAFVMPTARLDEVERNANGLRTRAQIGLKRQTGFSEDCCAREAKGPTEVKVPQAKATAVTNTDTKDTMVKSETKADVKAEAKDSMKKPETTDKGAVMDKVGTVHHKTEKTKDADKPAG